jgi:hypothetical protein
MDIHKPKPAHNWREFLSEIGVVVLGILIALALEEGLRTLHDRDTAREAREAVNSEIVENLSYMGGRLATQTCIERRLDEIGEILGASGEGELVRQPNWVGQPSLWFLGDRRWQAATGSGRVSLLQGEEQGSLGIFYVISARFNEAENHEQSAWAQLRALETWKGPLGPAGKVHFSAALQEARYELWETRILIGEAFKHADELGVKNYRPKPQSSGYAIPHAVCLPITTQREDALKILTRDGTPPWGQPK